jgi:hypothetical protein
MRKRKMEQRNLDSFSIFQILEGEEEVEEEVKEEAEEEMIRKTKVNKM